MLALRDRSPSSIVPTLPFASSCLAEVNASFYTPEDASTSIGYDEHLYRPDSLRIHSRAFRCPYPGCGRSFISKPNMYQRYCNHKDTLNTKEILPRRLINTRSYKLVTFMDDKPIPKYAIISHRWGEGEVNLRKYSLTTSRPGFSSGTESTNIFPEGYLKIIMACNYARSKGISWIWIDTFCIDQSDHEDVATSIESMYAYYQNAQICYAYLHDVSSSWSPTGMGIAEDIGESEWFSRGWTLQELLAPKEVVFFDKDWEEIGRRGTLTDIISLKTGIPEPVLKKEILLQDVDIAKRLSWSVNRQTTEPEDQAYCLLGILGVSMELRYGEGIQKAFKRLQQVLMKEYSGSLNVLDDVDDLFSLLHAWGLTSRLMVDEMDYCGILNWDSLTDVRFSERRTHIS